jgi:hypothetical protein
LSSPPRGSSNHVQDGLGTLDGFGKKSAGRTEHGYEGVDGDFLKIPQHRQVRYFTVLAVVGDAWYASEERPKAHCS